MSKLKYRPNHDPATGAASNDAVVLDPAAETGPAEDVGDDSGEDGGGVSEGLEDGDIRPNWDQFFRDLRRGKK